MMTLDTVRTAAMADQPWARLDGLVRAEMASGRRVRELADQFVEWADKVWATPGLSADGFDAFGDTMDALTGNCHSKSCYYDLPTLPTEQEIAELPRWARMALAARCARRCLWALGMATSESDLSKALAAAKAARDVEQVAEKKLLLFSFGHAKEQEFRALADDPWRGAENMALSVETYPQALRPLFESQLLVHTIWSVNRGHSEPRTEIVKSHRVITQTESVLAKWNVQHVIRRDFDRLAVLARYFRWTDDTPVPPDVFGPLWPEGPPAGWPVDPDVPAHTELPLTVVAREGVTSARLADAVVNLFNALNRYHIARTGRRLTLDGDVYTRLAALVPAGAA